MTARVIQTEEQNAHHAAVARHTAFPDAEDRHRLAQHLRFIEENVTESATDDHAEERTPGDVIGDLRQRQIRVTQYRECAQ